ncbi:hypothetical protein [Spirosoma validum]|uniref:CBM-cenC domain-containing protein n=1 Tax=Spirosoma validum TaxID=2771355 RepID=A0A927B8V7_9BACT|nr:hypothetical protein [Spirosoma validum]MBD2757499.1 hypothetical protein [Spirosoma validum]
MKRKLYLSLVLLCITLAGYGQGSQINSTVRTYPGGYYGVYGQLTFNAGYVVTPRNSPTTSSVYFTSGSSWTAASDGSYVDGYAETQGKTGFTFPVGREVTTDANGNPSPAGNGSLRTAGFSAPTATASDRFQGAYWQTNPTNATLPSGAMPSANVGTGVQTVSTVEYWDINGAVPATLTLTWDATSALATLTSNTLSNLTVVGYNPSTSKWENLGAAAVSGSLSGTGTISTSVAAFAPNTYTAYTFGSLTTSATGVAYIYLHKNATDEDSSPDFPFTVTGPNSFTGSYSLNDQHPTNFVRDVGATGNGGLYAVAGNSGASYPVYYRAANSSIWTQLAGLSATRIDGGPDNANIHMNSGGNVYYYNGTTTTNLGSTNAVDVAFDKSGTNRVFYVNSSGQLFYQNATAASGSWTQATGITTQNIDVAPTGRVVSTGGTNYATVYISDFNGTNLVNLGNPTGSGVGDVAVGDDGIIYAIQNNIVYRYSGGYAAGGSWVAEPTSRLAARITGGNNGQMWITAGSGGNNTPSSIWSRTAANGFWIDDESVRTAGSNSVLIPVTPGTYSVTETTTSGWDLGAIDVYDPTNNSTANVVSGTTSVNVAAGEVVHLVYRNFQVTNFQVVNTCTGTPYLETFGTGSTTTLGGPLTGQTSYHYIGTSGVFVQDGYYMVASNSSQAAAGGTAFGSFNDHTTGDGTGRMMLINASYDKGEFFRRRFTGLLPGTAYSFSAWIMNLNNLSIKPNVQFQIIDPATKTVLATLATGDITTVGQWAQYQLQFTASQGDVDLVLRNNNIGGGGNDLALDDISFGLARPNQPQVSVTNGTCNAPASLTITAPTGVSLEYSLDGTNFQSSTVFSPVTPGSYSVTARYTNSVGCVSTPAAVTVTATACVPDLSPVIYARPSTIYGTTPITVVVDVIELLGTPTSGTVVVYLSKDAKVSLNYDMSATLINSRSVQNSAWTVDASSNSNYYILTTSNVVPAGDKLSFGFTGTLTPGATTGTVTMSTVIKGGGGGEVRVNNNVDADKIDYFQQ